MSLINVAYYITGHGFGHVTRSLELIRGLLVTERFRVHVVTNIPRKFFHDELLEFQINIDYFPFTVDDKEQEQVTINQCEQLSFVHWDRNLDTGGIQRDVIYMDPLLTLDAYYREIHSIRDSLLNIEVQWLQQQHIHLILMDATTLACRAGSISGVKTVFVTNFSWDFIYQESLQDIKTLHLFDENPEEYEKYQQMITIATEDMLDCTYYIRYPGVVPLPKEFNMEKSCYGPLITRKIRNSQLREELKIPEGMKMLLLGFGGHKTEWSLEDSFLPTGWVCYVLRASPELMPSSRFIALPQNIYVPDWIHAADVVLGKIGYGFVSESLNGGTPLVYVPRVYWAEEDYLVKVVQDEYHAALPMPLEEFNRGNWEEYLQRAYELRNSWTIPPTIHPDTATEQIIGILDHVLDHL